MSSADLAEFLPLAASEIEGVLSGAGSAPVGTRGPFRLWSADDVLQHVFRVDPSSWRSGGTTAEVAA